MLNPMLVCVRGLEAGDEKLWEVVDDAIEGVDRGCVNAGG